MLNSIHVAQTGLSAARTSVEGVMNNISNENTPGYKKRIVELQESGHIDGSITGRGVIVSDVKRITDEYVFDNLLKEYGKESYYDEMSTRLGEIESLFFETEDSGFSSDLNRYFQALENLRSEPNSEINKNNVINNAEILVTNIKNLYDGIDELQTVSINTAKDDVEIINGILADIGTINEKLGQQLVPSNDLLDRRDALEKDLAEYADVDIDRSDDYELRIGGRIAVRYSTNIHNVTLVEEFTPQRDKYTTDGASDAGSIGDLLGGGGLIPGDVITYNLNDTTSVSVSEGETGIPGYDPVDANNYMRALVYKINNSTTTAGVVTAYNGATTVNATTGVESDTSAADSYLHIKSAVDGENGNFEGYISVSRTAPSKSVLDKDSVYSIDASDKVDIRIFDEPINLTRGSLKAVLDNVDSNSILNKFESYKDKLDAFVTTFVDVHNSFNTQTDGTYLYGKKYADTVTTGSETSVGMFSGSTVSTFKFNSGSMTSMNQEKLNYLATIQWKDDLDFDGSIQNTSTNSASSFASYYQTAQVQVASDKENNDYLQDTQGAIVNALEGSYDKLVKVDKDTEMINLIKFQSAYEANAKIVTIVDEMLGTLLGMVR